LNDNISTAEGRNIKGIEVKLSLYRPGQAVRAQAGSGYQIF
jgi:hypothetical protein